MLYDKIKDLAQTKSRSVEKDKEFNPQLSLFDDVRKKKKKPIEVLRIELRIVQKRKLTALLNKIGIKQDEHNFRNTFKESIARAVLLFFWHTIQKSIKPILIANMPEIALFEEITKNKKIKPQKALALFGLAQILKNEGSRKLRQIFDKRFSVRSFSRIIKDLEKIKTHNLAVYEPFLKIEKDLKAFLPTTCKDFELHDLLKKIVEFLR